MTHSLLGMMVIFNRNSPSNWSDFVSSGDSVCKGDIGVIVAYESTRLEDNAEVKVYRVLVEGRIVSAWEDEMTILAKQSSA